MMWTWRLITHRARVNRVKFVPTRIYSNLTELEHLFKDERANISVFRRTKLVEIYARTTATEGLNIEYTHTQNHVSFCSLL